MFPVILLLQQYILGFSCSPTTLFSLQQCRKYPIFLGMGEHVTDLMLSCGKSIAIEQLIAAEKK